MDKFPKLSVRTDEERAKEAAKRKVEEEGFECQVVRGGAPTGGMEYGGFCPVAFVSGQGFVLPGAAAMGVLRYQGREVQSSDKRIWIKEFNNRC